MPGIDESRKFIPVTIAVLTVSDTRTLETDTSGAILAERISRAGHVVADRVIEKDDAGLIEAHLRRWMADETIDVVITTGGTGIWTRPRSTRPIWPSTSGSSARRTRWWRR